MDIFPEDLRSFPHASPAYLGRKSLIAYYSKKILRLKVPLLAEKQLNKRTELSGILFCTCI